MWSSKYELKIHKDDFPMYLIVKGCEFVNGIYKQRGTFNMRPLYSSVSDKSVPSIYWHKNEKADWNSWRITFCEEVENSSAYTYLLRHDRMFHHENNTWIKRTKKEEQFEYTDLSISEISQYEEGAELITGSTQDFPLQGVICQQCSISNEKSASCATCLFCGFVEPTHAVFDIPSSQIQNKYFSCALDR